MKSSSAHLTGENPYLHSSGPQSLDKKPDKLGVSSEPPFNTLLKPSVGVSLGLIPPGVGPMLYLLSLDAHKSDILQTDGGQSESDPSLRSLRRENSDATGP